MSYAPRVKVPVLMLNTRNVAIFPYETGQFDAFNLFGTPANQKRQQVYPGGHSYHSWYDDLVREHYDWLDLTQHPGIPATTPKSTSPAAK